MFSIDSDRLLLEPVSMLYAGNIFSEYTEQITTYMKSAPHPSAQATYKFIKDSEAAMKRNAELHLVVLKKEDREFLGCAAIYGLQSKQPELSLWLKKSVQQNGFGLEAMSALIGWARENLEFEYLKYPVDKRNTACVRIPKHFGGTIKNSYPAESGTGASLDIVEYGIN